MGKKHITFQKGRKRILSQHTVIPKSQMKDPNKKIPVRISSKLVVYVNDESKIEAAKIKYSKYEETGLKN